MKVKMTCLSCGAKYILKLDIPDITSWKSNWASYACGVCDSQEFDVEEMENKDA